MIISNVRVDSRGIHGQVATAWVSHLGVSRIMVIDDQIVKDDLQKMALKMACPSQVKLSILSIGKATERLNDPSAYPDEKIMIIFSGIEGLYNFYKNGYKLTNVNIGNIPSRPDTRKIFNTVYLSEDEISKILEMSKGGIIFTAQQVPTKESYDLLKQL